MNTNECLRKLRKKHGLTNKKISELVFRKQSTVNCWFKKGKGKRNMPFPLLKLLKIELGETK